MNTLEGKNIVIGITGCIAAYKIPELIRLFVKANANVTVVTTESALNFVTPLVLTTLTGNRVHTEMFELPETCDVNHISLADRADLMLIAPATANIIGKIANGIADDLLTTTVMAAKGPVIIAPAMNSAMWNNSIVQNNIEKLKASGYKFIDPDTGYLACGCEGPGRLKDIDDIFHYVENFFQPEKPLKGKKVLVTAGGTREYIDPVRFITNKSSGKMGYAIAEAAVNLGANVDLISTVNKPLSGAKLHPVETVKDMQQKLQELFSDVDVLIMAAAVSDYMAASYSEHKIKKSSEQEIFSINMVKTPDLIADLASRKKSGQIVAGFAAETEDLIANAKRKMETKNLDLIVANDVSLCDCGMNSEYNCVDIIFPDGKLEHISKRPKIEIAYRLLKVISSML
jgi:phosphopantothenoylcysteine decarboxylase/phosphopantothenate--cysteine ligase